MMVIVMEVVAAFGISIISGLEIAALNDKASASNLEAKQAEAEAGQANERTSRNELVANS